MNVNSILKLAALGVLTTFYAVGSQPVKSASGASGPTITMNNTCSGGGATCNCSGKCSASGSGCSCN
jgi:hypothetical protein